MGRELTISTLENFLAEVGNRLSFPTQLILLGGSGLILLGHHRPTIDIDFEGDEGEDSETRRLLERVAE